VKTQGSHVALHAMHRLYRNTIMHCGAFAVLRVFAQSDIKIALQKQMHFQMHTMGTDQPDSIRNADQLDLACGVGIATSSHSNLKDCLGS